MPLHVRLLALACALVWAPAIADEGEVSWEWQRVRPWEYVAGPALIGGAIALRFAGPQPDRTWQGGILFDDAIDDALAVRTRARVTIGDVTDAAFYSAMGFRLIDSALLPGLVHGSWDVSLQMSFIDMEAFGVVAAVLWGTQVFVGRERPYVAVCRSDPHFAATEGDCHYPNDDWNRSFISGHPAVGVTAAALTCLHHSHMPLYGGGWGDDAACGLSIAAAAVNGIGRVVAEKHYASDLILGVALGLTAGYVVPKTLHYGWGDRSTPEREARRGPAILPTFSGDGIGVAVAGVL
jgi:membrane-associated phospholipid phosphatase